MKEFCGEEFWAEQLWFSQNFNLPELQIAEFQLADKPMSQQDQRNGFIGNEQRTSSEHEVVAPRLRTIYTQFENYEEQFQIKIVEPDWEMMLEFNHWNRLPRDKFYFCISRINNSISKKQYHIDDYSKLLPQQCMPLCLWEFEQKILDEIKLNKNIKVRMNLGKTIFSQTDENGEIRPKIMGKMVDLGKLNRNINNNLVSSTFSNSIPALGLIKIKLYLMEKLKFYEEIQEKTVFTLYISQFKPDNNQENIQDQNLNSNQQTSNFEKKRPINQFVISFLKDKNSLDDSTYYKFKKIRFGYTTKKRIQFLQNSSKLDSNFKFQVEKKLNSAPEDVLEFIEKCVKNLNQNGLHSEFKRLFDVEQQNIKLDTVRRKKKCVLIGKFNNSNFKVSLTNCEINQYVNKQSEVAFWCKDLKFLNEQNQFYNEDQEKNVEQKILTSLNTCVQFYQKLSEICGGVLGFAEKPQEDDL